MILRLTESEIPSGRDARDSQADGAAPRTTPGGSSDPAPAATEKNEPNEPAEQVFEASVAWSGNARGTGAVRLDEADAEIRVAGSTRLGGAGGAANPEELLLAALAACFVNTWAIFLEKLKIPYADPTLRVAGTLGPDPAGGFRMTGAVIHARVPAALLEADREKVAKSLALSEKYCIISKVARAAMPVQVEIEPV